MAVVVIMINGYDDNDGDGDGDDDDDELHHIGLAYSHEALLVIGTVTGD